MVIQLLIPESSKKPFLVYNLLYAKVIDYYRVQYFYRYVHHFDIHFDFFNNEIYFDIPVLYNSIYNDLYYHHCY